MSEMLFDGDVAVVTGAGRGIGREHALELARRGARVVVNDVGGGADGSGDDAGPAQSVADEIRAGGGEAVASTDSVDSPEGGAAIIERAVAEFGRVDVVVNNAGIVRDKMFHNMTPELLDSVLRVHLYGTFHVTIPAWQRMREQGYGRVVNTTSASGMFGNAGQANYGAAKMGILGLTRVLALEGRKSGIKANAVAPAAATRMNAEMLGDQAHLLEPKHIAPVVGFLAHRDCELSGQVLSAGGGHVSAVQISVTRGITEPELSAEAIRDRLGEVFEPEGGIVPRHIGDELKFIFGSLPAEAGS